MTEKFVLFTRFFKEVKKTCKIAILPSSVIGVVGLEPYHSSTEILLNSGYLASVSEGYETVINKLKIKVEEVEND